MQEDPNRAGEQGEGVEEEEGRCAFAGAGQEEEEVWYDPTQYVGLWQLVSWVNQGSIAYFSMVFCAKLGVVVVRRRRMGMRGFGAMEVMWVMAGQTMLVPGELSCERVQLWLV